MFLLGGLGSGVHPGAPSQTVSKPLLPEPSALTFGFHLGRQVFFCEQKESWGNNNSEQSCLLQLTDGNFVNATVSKYYYYYGRLQSQPDVQPWFAIFVVYLSKSFPKDLGEADVNVLKVLINKI